VKTVSKIPDLRLQINEWRSNKQSIAFVPTMGNLHAGHLNLVEKALTIADRVIVSIFVNPLQFGPHEDYENYPRTLQSDSEKLAQLNTHLLFTPYLTDLYPTGLENTTSIKIPGLSEILCGASRPIFFQGIATVVNILFNLVQPYKALFGEKYYHQVLIIKRMVADFFMPIEIIGIPIVRETDALAMSSRNNYLNTEQRAIAPHLFQIINEMKSKIEAGEGNFTKLEQEAKQLLTTAGFKPDYIAVRSKKNLEIPTSTDKELIILVAAYLGSTRLIDNIFC
jgi:pantoate--beta-alanine ligase